QRAQQPPGALVGARLGRAIAVARGPAQLRRLLARQARRLVLAVQRLRDRCRAALVRQAQHLDLEHVLAAHNPQRIAHAHQARGLRALAVDLDLARLDRLPGQRTGAEEARRPQPDVDAHAALRGCSGSGSTHVRVSCRGPERKRPPIGGRSQVSPGAGAPAALLGVGGSRGGGGLGARLGVAGQVFLDARLLALEATQVVQLAGADATAALDLDRLDRRAVGLEHALDAVAVRDLAHGERGVEAGVLLADDHAFIGLDALAVALLHLHVHDDGVAGTEFGELALDL